MIRFIFLFIFFYGGFVFGLNTDFIQLEKNYVTEYFNDLDSGLGNGSELNMKLQFNATVALDYFSYFSNTTGFLSFYMNNGMSINDRIGSMQGVSNLDAPANFKLYELWLQKDMVDQQYFRMGLMDLNAEFDVIQTAQFFVNPSHGIGYDFSQTGDNGPAIYPNTSFGLHWKLGMLTFF